MVHYSVGFASRAVDEGLSLETVFLTKRNFKRKATGREMSHRRRTLNKWIKKCLSRLFV